MLNEVIMQFEETFCKYFSKYSSKPHMAARILLYIFFPLFKIPTVAAAAAYFDIPKDKIYRSLAHLKPDTWLRFYRAMAYARLFEYCRQISQNGSAFKSRYRITLSCDDTSFMKWAKKMPFVGYVYHSLAGRSVMGTGALYFFIEIGDGKAKFPLDLRLYRGKGRRGRPALNRHEAIQRMLRDLKQAALNAGIDIERMVFVADSWFASESLFDTLWDTDIPGVVKGKKSYVFTINAQQVKAGNLLKIASLRRYEGLMDCMYDRFTAWHPSFGDVILTVVRTDQGQWYYLIATEPMHTSPKMIQDYRKRWAIEVFFRDSKQLLALGIFMFQDKRKIIAHFVLRSLSFWILDLIRVKLKPKLNSIGDVLKWILYDHVNSAWIQDFKKNNQLLLEVTAS